LAGLLEIGSAKPLMLYHGVTSGRSTTVHRYSLVFLSLLRDDVTLWVECCKTGIRIMITAFYPRCWIFLDEKFGPNSLDGSANPYSVSERDPVQIDLQTSTRFDDIDKSGRKRSLNWSKIQVGTVSLKTYRVQDSWRPKLNPKAGRHNLPTTRGGRVLHSAAILQGSVFCGLWLNNLSRPDSWIQLPRSV